MARTRVRVTFANPRGVRQVTDKIRAELVQRIAQTTVDRAIKRTGPHPSVTRMKVAGVNQNAATIFGVPGPGINMPVAVRAGSSAKPQYLRFNPGGGVIFRRSARYVGLEPLLRAEAAKIQASELDLESIDPT